MPSPGRGARLGRSPQPPAIAFEQRGAVANFGDASREAVVAAHEIGGEQRLRLRCTSPRGVPCCSITAAVEQQDAVGHRHRLGLVVRDAQRRQLHAHDQLAQPGARFLAQLRVEIRQRLVEQDHRRVVDERAGERDALLLAARKLVRKALGEMAERELLERRAHARADIRRARCCAASARRRRCRTPSCAATARTTGTRARGCAPRPACRRGGRRRTRPCRRSGSCPRAGLRDRPRRAAASSCRCPRGRAATPPRRGRASSRRPFRIGLSP